MGKTVSIKKNDIVRELIRWSSSDQQSYKHYLIIDEKKYRLWTNTKKDDKERLFDYLTKNDVDFLYSTDAYETFKGSLRHASYLCSFWVPAGTVVDFPKEERCKAYQVKNT